MANNPLDSQQSFSSVAQTASIGSATSVSSGAAKIFREFKWGLLTLFILMAVIIGLWYDGGLHKKKTDVAVKSGSDAVDGLSGTMTSDGASGTNVAASDKPQTGTATPPLGGTAGGIDPVIQGPNRPVISEEPDPFGQPRGGTDTARGGARIPEPGTDDPRATAENRNRQPKASILRESHGTEHAEPRKAHESEQAPAAFNGDGKVYVVKAGDNLTRIATQHQLGKNGVKVILAANKEVLHDANMLREGMKLTIPAAALAEEVRLPATGKRNAGHDREPAGEHTAQLAPSHAEDYTVQAGDSLERIARKVLNDGRKWKDLLEWNKDKISEPTKIRVGMVLRVHGESHGDATGIKGTGGTVRAATEPPEHPRRNEVNTDSRREPETAAIPSAPVSASRATSRNPESSAIEELKKALENPPTIDDGPNP